MCSHEDAHDLVTTASMSSSREPRTILAPTLSQGYGQHRSLTPSSQNDDRKTRSYVHRLNAFSFYSTEGRQREHHRKHCVREATISKVSNKVFELASVGGKRKHNQGLRRSQCRFELIAQIITNTVGNRLHLDVV